VPNNKNIPNPFVWLSGIPPLWRIVVAVGLLLTIGLVTVYSATSAQLLGEGASPVKDLLQQAAFAVIGIAIAVVLARAVAPEVIQQNWALWGLWLLSMALLFATWAFGTEINGAKRWLNIGPLSTQPSEFVKVFLLCITSKLVFDFDGDIRTFTIRILGFVFLPLGILFVTQSDMGTTAITAVGIIAVMALGRMPGRVVGATIFIVVVGGAIGLVASSYRSSRFVFLDPWNDGDDGYGAGYNIIRAYYAIAEGGLFGKGIGSSHEKYDYLFASESDFIFAIIGEELGMFGCLLVIALFLVILFAALRIARDAAEPLHAMLAGGAGIMLTFQAFLNIASTIGVAPTTGKPLPFISSGGTSLIASFILIGIILAVDKANAVSPHERARQNLRVVRRS
jgi:cell division protein FtsW